MSRYIPGNQKHLTLDDRIYIETELNKTSVSIVITAGKQMPAARTFSAALNALPALPAIKSAKTFKKSPAAGWKRLRMSAMGAQKRSVIAQSPINILIMPALPIGNTGKSFGNPGWGST